jgi:hypothetical protein
MAPLFLLFDQPPLEMRQVSVVVIVHSPRDLSGPMMNVGESLLPSFEVKLMPSPFNLTPKQEPFSVDPGAGQVSKLVPS